MANLQVELVANAGTLLTVGLLSSVVKMSLGGGMPCRTTDNGARCDPSALWSLDRDALGQRSRAWAITSDISQGLALGGAAAAVVADALWHHGARPGHEAAVDFVVLFESFNVANSVNQLLKFAVRRARPQLYAVDGRRGFEGQLSFPSGHTLAAASALGGWSTIFAVRHPRSPWRFAPAAVAAAGTGVVAYGRVRAGAHFPSDVMAAAVLGGVSGFVVPMLHRTPRGDTWQLQGWATPTAQGLAQGIAVSGPLP